MSKRAPTKAELERAWAFVHSRRWEYIAKIAQTFFRCCGFVGVAYFVYLSIDALKGAVTVADISISANAKADICETSAWTYGAILVSFVLGVCGMAYGWLQRGLRKDTIESLAPYKQQLELQHDNKRTSSGLMPNGSTHPKDE